jgi:hypothetical protein
VTFQGTIVDRLRDGKIVDRHEILDAFGLFQQLGVGRGPERLSRSRRALQIATFRRGQITRYDLKLVRVAARITSRVLPELIHPLMRGNSWHYH